MKNNFPNYGSHNLNFFFHKEILTANLLQKAHKSQNITNVYSPAANKDIIYNVHTYNHRSTSHVYNAAYKINGGK